MYINVWSIVLYSKLKHVDSCVFPSVFKVIKSDLKAAFRRRRQDVILLLYNITFSNANPLRRNRTSFVSMLPWLSWALAVSILTVGFLLYLGSLSTHIWTFNRLCSIPLILSLLFMCLIVLRRRKGANAIHGVSLYNRYHRMRTQ